MKTQQAIAISAAVAAFALAATSAQADQSATSSDGAWKASSSLAGSLAVKSHAQATVKITPAAGGAACPQVANVLFEMPSHGHGGDVDPKSAAAGTCEWKITDLAPSMGGEWRLRLVVKDGGKSSNIDFMVQAK